LLNLILNTTFTKALATLLLGLFLFTSTYAQEKKKIVIRQADKQEYKKQVPMMFFGL
jgi:hypothetical protein